MTRVAVVLFDGAEEMDFAGPYEVFALATEVFTVAAEPAVRAAHGLRVNADHTFADAPIPDVLVVPGGAVTRLKPEALHEVIEYVRRTAPHCRLILSVCTGTFILARAGLLAGKACTTHYRRRHQLLAQFPDLKLRYSRVVADGRFITTAGVSAGLDGSLFALAKLFDNEVARKVAKSIEYPWQPMQTLQATSVDDEVRYGTW